MTERQFQPCRFLILLAMFSFAVFATTSMAQYSGGSIPVQKATLDTGVQYPSNGTAAMFLATGDLNGDGKADIVVVSLCTANLSTCRAGQYPSADGVVSILLGNGDGTFQPAITYDSGGGAASSVAIADLNHDGNPDVVVANECRANGDCTHSSVSVFLGNGDGTLRSPVSYDSGGFQFSWDTTTGASVAIGDVNGDGKPDLVVANQDSFNSSSNGVIGVLLGNGDGSFKPGATYENNGVWPSSVVLADMNGDGKPDIVVSNYGDGSVGILPGRGDGTFGLAALYDLGSYASSLAVSDLNNDGRPDLVVAVGCGIPKLRSCLEGGVSVLLADKSGSFKPAVTYLSADFYAGNVVVADLNGDGIPDVLQTGPGSVVVGGAVVMVFLGNGDGTLQSPTLYPTLDGATPLIVGDWNGDSTVDLALGELENVEVGLNTSAPLKSASATSLISNLDPSAYGQKVTFTATVSHNGGTIPTGKVTFRSGFNSIGSVAVDSNGIASLGKSNFGAGTFRITAAYQGDSTYRVSTSSAVVQIVKSATSKAMLSASPNPSSAGQPVTFTAKITSPTVIPTGPVTFLAGNTVLGTVQLNHGSAALTISSLPSGSTVITVKYGGNSNMKGSAAAVTQVVQ